MENNDSGDENPMLRITLKMRLKKALELNRIAKEHGIELSDLVARILEEYLKNE